MSITISQSNSILRGMVDLPSSKSECNRLLILRALSKGKIRIENISDARDTKILQAALASDELEINIGDAGTAMRFLTAYYCAAGEHKILSGSERMCERPIGILVNALRDIGFDINYLKSEGFPPLEIIPTDHSKLKSKVSIAGNVSSQYISALMMIAPVLEGGLEITFTTEVSSRPYIDLSAKLMQDAGIELMTSADNIHIPAQSFKPIKLHAGADWSAASYWCSMAAIAKDAEIMLRKLSMETSQGDVQIVKWAEKLGVDFETIYDGICVRTGRAGNSVCHFDFTDHPDLAQTVIVLCAAKNIKATFSGLQSLRIKETDRIMALQNELLKFGVKLEEIRDGKFELTGRLTMSDQIIDTYNDHRMAMAFAPLALLGPITINDPEVVEKSYPGFWDEMQKVGFEITSNIPR